MKSCLIPRGLLDEGFTDATKKSYNDFLRESKFYRLFASLSLVDRYAPYSFIKHDFMTKNLNNYNYYSNDVYCA